MKQLKSPHIRIRVLLGFGALVAAVLSIQCVRTYLYINSVLVPRHAEREAERQSAALTSAARSAAITDPSALKPVIEHVLESASDRVLWMRLLDPDGNVFVQGGKPEAKANIPPQWWSHVEKHETVSTLLDSSRGKVLVAMLPFRLSRPDHRPANHHSGSYVIEVAVPFKAVAGAFDGLRQNLIVGVIASIALLFSVAVIGLRAPHYFRGKYLESEMQLARRVQADLLPKPRAVSEEVEFAASVIAADHVGGDFYDIFKAESGEIVIVLGDVSGKGIPAALLVNVLQGAIRSSTVSHHEQACERINRMLCERSACERFATLFWAVFDPVTRTLRYVNAGHVPPILIRQTGDSIERLDEGGPVLGLLPNAPYSARIVEIQDSDTLVLYSDGISEAADEREQEFGDARIAEIGYDHSGCAAAEICELLMDHVTNYANDGEADDRTLVVLRFLPQAPHLLNAPRTPILEEAVA